MAYRLQVTGNLECECRRIAGERLAKALHNIEDRDIGLDDRIHRVRKRLKEVRGLIRLFRSSLGKYYGKENERLREIGRMLSPYRDEDATLESLNGLAERFPERGAAIESVRGAIQRSQSRLVGEGRNCSRQILEARSALERAQQASECLTLNRLDHRSFTPGMRKTYERCRAAARSGIEAGESTALHQWRKRVKCHRYHVRLLQDIWPAMMKARHREPRILSEFLGFDHDLAILDQRLCGVRRSAASMQEVRQLMDERHSELRAAASRLGARMFAEKPKPLVKRFKTYWKLARSGADG